MTRRLILPVLLLAACAGGIAIAQSDVPDALTLDQAMHEAQAAELRSASLSERASKAKGEADLARAKADALIGDIDRIEAEITLAELRVAEARRKSLEQRARLGAREQPVIRLTSALETMSRRPPVLALVQPGSVEDIVRVRAMLASTLPLVRQRSAGLRREVAAGDRLRAEADAALADLANGRKQLKERRIALAAQEEQELRRSQDLQSAALTETDRSVALGEEGRTLAALMQTRAYQARLGADLIGLPGPAARPGTGNPPPSSANAAPYRLPVEGKLVSGMGEISEGGVHARGLTFRTSPNAPVLAPRAGRIVYAGRFRSYGEIAIIDHGAGWATTITNMGALRVRQGDSVRPGDPIGRASGQVTVELRHNGQPRAITAYIG